MRIIAGRLKGRRLTAVPGTDVRPTSDALRETLFNVLGPTLDGARVLDAFAGTGAIGLEALSRGAAHATFVERDGRALAVLRANVDHCGVADACSIIRGDFLRDDRTRGAGFTLVVLDPPYAIASLDEAVARAVAAAAPTGRIVLEHSRRRPSPEHAGSWQRTRVLAAGDSALSFYERGGE
jgi:16S rRNA (guanine(966)-N(2))-methyltransferase RsmD